MNQQKWTNAGGCGCGGAPAAGGNWSWTAGPESGICGDGCTARVNYYPGQFLTDQILMAEQQYHLGKRWLHNRALHGWGVVCGLELDVNAQTGVTFIRPGLALDPCGREIQVPRDIRLELAAAISDCARKARGDCQPGTVPPLTHRETAYSRIKVNPNLEKAPGSPLDRYWELLEAMPMVVVALKYREAAADPEPAFLPQSGCEAECAPSRIHEGYCVELLCLRDMDESCRQALLWHLDVLNSIRTGNWACTMGGAATDCPYIFLGLVALGDNGYQFSGTLRRPVLTWNWFVETLYKLQGNAAGTRLSQSQLQKMQQYEGVVYNETVRAQLEQQGVQVAAVRKVMEAPTVAQAESPVTVYVDWAGRVVHAEPAAEAATLQGEVLRLQSAVKTLTSPAYRVAQQAVAMAKVSPLQEPLATALTAETTASMPIEELQSGAAVQQELKAMGITTVGALMDRWDQAAAKLGDQSGAVLKEVMSATAAVAEKVSGSIAATGAMRAEAVKAEELAPQVGLSPVMMETVLRNVLKLRP